MPFFSIVAQYSANYWYFGEHAGLSFFNQLARPEVNGALSSNEACASYSDAFGALKAYSNGEIVWNAGHSPMQNGTGLSGHTSASQGAVFVPHPGNSDQVFLFTLGEFGSSSGLSWSLIDFAQAGGLGAVTRKNVAVRNGLSEQISAWRNHDGSYWLLVHGYLSNSFYAWKIDRLGVAASPVVSQVGPVDQSGIGCMAIAPNGKQLAISYRTLNAVNIFDFDPISGKVGNPLLLASDIHLAYGLAFSPDSKRLYAARSAEDDGSGHKIDAAVLQFDLALPAFQIPASRTVVGLVAVEKPGALQLAPDGRIYLARYNSSFLGIIQQPNLPATQASYVDQGFSLLGNASNLGLPVFPANNVLINPEIKAEPVCQHQTAHFFANKLVAVDSVSWRIVQPDNQELVFGNQQQIQAGLAQYGDHQVDLVYFRGDYPDTVHITYFVFPNPVLALPEDTAICPGSTLLIDASMPWMAGDTTLRFSWSQGGDFSQISIKQSGRYVLEVQNMCGTAKDSFELSHRSLPHVFLGNDTLLCSGTELELSVGTVYPDTRMLWNTGETTPVIRVTDISRVSVMMTDRCGQAHDEIRIEWESLPLFFLPPRFDLCPGELASLKAGPELAGVDYRWEDGTPGPDRVFFEKGSFWVEMSGKICRDTAWIHVDELRPPAPTSALIPFCVREKGFI
ncbi:MAG: hypothetical protein R3B47_04135 [Bacteroidia bacterium]